MRGYRKLAMTLCGMLLYGWVATVAKGPVDYMTLGMGIGMLIAPGAVANIFEHKYGSKA